MRPQKRVALVCALGAALLSFSPSAFASRARTLVLGTGDAGVLLNGGSLLFEDEYNIFYNPAYVNDFKNWAIIEKSNGPAGSAAQGGFVQSLASLSFGLFLNRGDAVVTAQGLAGGSTAPYVGALRPERPLELFLGLDVGMKFGVSLAYASQVQPAGNASEVTLGLGAVIDAFEPFVTLKPSGIEPTAKHSFYRVGTRYRWGEWIPYFAVATASDKPVDGALKSPKETSWGIGISRSTKVGPGVKMHYGTGFLKISDTNGDVEGARKIIPIDLSFEGELLSWLTLNAGLSYRLLDRVQFGTTGPLNVADRTSGRMGALIRANKIDFEWVFGKRVTATVANNALESTAAIDAQNFDLANGFFTAASLTYRW